MASTTLRDLSGFDNSPSKLGSSVLIMIDFQNTYRTGVMKLEGAEEAVAAGARLLERARDLGSTVIHVQHNGGKGSPYDINEEIGRISQEVAPMPGESIVVKQFPNAFHDTDLLKLLARAGPEKDLVIAGFMTHMCVTFTSEGAFNHGYRATVVADTTATRSLASPDGSVVSAAALKSSSLTTISDMFGVVVASADALPD